MRRKTTGSIFLGTILLIFALLPPAQGAPLSVGDGIKFFDIFTRPYGYLGGPYTADAKGASFATFCVELDETISFGTAYTIGGIGNTTVASGKTLSPEVKYLYYNYRIGNLDALYPSFSYDDAADQRTLQGAIWRWMGWSVPIGQTGFFDSDLYAQLTGDSVKGRGSDIDHVVILNIIDVSQKNRQDVLAMVPEPATFLLLGFGLFGLSFLGRRKIRS
ncbi:MAG: PEP-CTERM sorting domain-containing protein [Desulfobacterales bacterium]